MGSHPQLAKCPGSVVSFPLPDCAGKGEPTDNAKGFYEWLMSNDRDPGASGWYCRPSARLVGLQVRPSGRACRGRSCPSQTCARGVCWWATVTCPAPSLASIESPCNNLHGYATIVTVAQHNTHSGSSTSPWALSPWPSFAYSRPQPLTHPWHSLLCSNAHLQVSQA